MKLYIPIIAYNGSVSTEFMLSMMNFQQYLIKNKYEATFYPITFESLISRARNASASLFLESNMDYLFFVDTDIAFSPMDFEKLVKAGKEVCGGIYPKKYLNREKLKYISKNETDNVVLNHIEELSTDFSSEVSNQIVNSKLPDYIEIDNIATGFLLIKKTAFLKIINKFPDIEYNNDIDGYGVDGNKFYNFFNVCVDENKKYLSEDYGFCDLYKKSGGKIHAATNINLTHIGRKSYTGNVQNQSVYWSNKFNIN